MAIEATFHSYYEQESCREDASTDSPNASTVHNIHGNQTLNFDKVTLNITKEDSEGKVKVEDQLLKVGHTHLLGRPSTSSSLHHSYLSLGTLSYQYSFNMIVI